MVVGSLIPSGLLQPCSTPSYSPLLLWKILTHLVSLRVCCRCEYVTFLFPLCWNAAVIDPFHRYLLVIVLQTSLASLALSAMASASAPQHILTCFRMFPVERASFVSRNWHMVTLQLRTLHLNPCACWPLITEICGLGSKKAYTGEDHSFICCSIHRLS